MKIKFPFHINFFNEKSGSASVEYALILSLLASGFIVSASQLSTNVSDQFLLTSSEIAPSNNGNNGNNGNKGRKGKNKR